ncbi:MAG: hypothetical protein ABIF87_15685 [Pseudomonadota bacterium]
MQAHKDTKVSRELLSSLHYSNIEEAGLDMLLLSAQANYSEFSSEAHQSEKKYRMKFEDFQKKVEEKIGEEDFGQEDDLMAWKFAQESAEYWKQKIKELRTCCSNS